MRIVLLIISSFLLLGMTSAQIFSPSEGSNVSVVVDADAPFITIISPSAITYTSQAIPLTYTIVEASLDSIWYAINDGPNTTLTDSTTLSLPVGTHTVHVFANDSFGRVGQASISFTIIESEEEPFCGDEACDPSESCNSCTSDCGICQGGRSNNNEELVEPISNQTNETTTIPPQEETPEQPESTSLGPKMFVGLALILLILTLVYMRRKKKTLKKEKDLC